MYFVSLGADIEVKDFPLVCESYTAYRIVYIPDY